MRISDRSSDVCSSDLCDHTADHRVVPRGVGAALGQAQGAGHHGVVGGGKRKGGQSHFSLFPFGCREPWGKSDSDPFFFPLPAFLRSEKHTSELQSLMRISYAVFCLKKKNTTTTQKLSY